VKEAGKIRREAGLVGSRPVLQREMITDTVVAAD